MSDASSIRQYIEEWLNWDAETAVSDGETEDEIRAYFTRESFAQMWGKDQAAPDARWTYENLADEAIAMADEIRNCDDED